MKKTVIAFLVGGFLGAVAGAGAMLVAFPFLFPPPALNEAPPQAAAGDGTTAAARLGNFEFDRNAPGRDPIHWANGTGGIYRSGDGLVLRFDPNFEAGPGPNFVIYLNTTAVGEENAFNADTGRLKLASLRSFTGAQNYTLPADIDLSRYHTVTIWCETFGVYIGSAVLPKGTG